MPRLRPRLLSLLLVLPLGLAACGSSGESPTEAEAPALKTMPGRQPDCAAPGFPLTEVDLPDGLAAAVPTPQGWDVIPADPAGAPAFRMEKNSSSGPIASVVLTLDAGSKDARGDVSAAISAREAQAEPGSFSAEEPGTTCGHPSQYAEYTSAEEATAGDGVIVLAVGLPGDDGTKVLTLTATSHEMSTPDDDAELQVILAGLQAKEA